MIEFSGIGGFSPRAVANAFRHFASFGPVDQVKPIELVALSRRPGTDGEETQVMLPTDALDHRQ